MMMSPLELSDELFKEVHYLECCVQRHGVWVLCRLDKSYKLLYYVDDQWKELGLVDVPKSGINGYGGRCLGAFSEGIWLITQRGLYLYRRLEWEHLYCLSGGGALGYGSWHLGLNAWVGVLEVSGVQQIVAIDGGTGRLSKWMSGADFYASPQLNDQGTVVRWIEWNHPNMSWDESTLMEADIVNFALVCPRKVYYKHQVAVAYPKWANGQWWSQHDEDGFGAIYAESMNCFTGPFDCSHPQWVAEQPQYGHCNQDFYSMRINNAKVGVVRIQPDGIENSIFDDSMVVSTMDVNDNGLVCCAKGINKEQGVYFLKGSNEIKCLLGGKEIESEFDLHPIHHDGVISWLWWPKKLASAKLILKIHGGPTAMVSPEFDWKRQFWVSNGFAYLEVNYKGSSGFGRAYRQQLYGEWGALDVEHCHEVLTQVKRQFKVHSVIAKGGSAGGMTALLLALRYPLSIQLVSCYYPVTSQQSLTSTHRFESHYCKRLLDPLVRMPEERVDELNLPVFICQGTEDKVVQPNDTRDFVNKLSLSNPRVEYHEIEGEGHGFKSPDNLTKVLKWELDFFRRQLH